MRSRRCKDYKNNFAHLLTINWCCNFACHCFKGRTAFETAFSQTRHRRRNGYGREGRTTPEAEISQTRHRRRNGYGREGRTAPEAVISQTRHGRRNGYGHEGRTISVFRGD